MKEKVVFFFLLFIALAAASCKNIFHDMTASLPPVSLPALPEVEYTYPKNGDTGVPINRFILVSFSNDMDFTGLEGGEFTVTRDGEGIPLTAGFVTYNDRIIIIKPATLDPDAWYSVTLTKNLVDVNGLRVPAGYSWHFHTIPSSDPNYMDTTRPTVKITPANGNFVHARDLKVITAEFNEDVDPLTIKEVNFKVQKSGSPPVTIDGTVNYSIKIDGGDPRWIMTFTPTTRSQIENNTLYTVMVGGVKDLADNPQDPDPENSNFWTGSIMVELANAGNIVEGSATFGTVGTKGHSLHDENDIELYKYLDLSKEFPMAPYFDEGTSGSLAAGRSVRIVVGGKNIRTGIGPGNVILDPIYHDLSPGIVSPPGNRCYIDPQDGRFVLPRPSYWSKLENADNINLRPEIKEEEPSASTFSFPAGKWGSCARAYSYCAFPATWTLNPFGNNCIINRGTLSFWLKMDTDFSADGMCTRMYFGGASNYVSITGSTVTVIINNTNVIAATNSTVNDGWHHIYIVWDNVNKSLAGDKYRLMVFIDGADMYPDNDVLGTEWTPGRFYLTFSTAASALIHYIISFDNLKIWKHVVSEDPTWEYNGRNGRERALHYIYGPDAVEEYDYRPRLKESGSGVGYYY